jgi:Uma2 family endonuclease
MNTKSHATIEDLYRVPDNAKAELVNGEIVIMTPTGPQPGRAAMKIAFSLYEYELRTNSGHAVGDNVGFVVNLPNRESFSPDAAFYKGAVGMKFVQGAPLFAAEVRSEGDYGPTAEREMAAKRADYFAAGTQVVWDVDLLGSETVRVYRAASPAQPTIYRRGEIAEAEPALPGWSMPVDDMFD